MVNFTDFVDNFQGALSKGHDIYKQSAETEVLQQQSALRDSLQEIQPIQFVENENGLRTVDPNSYRNALEQTYNVYSQFTDPATAMEARNAMRDSLKATGRDYMTGAFAALQSGDLGRAVENLNAYWSYVPDGSFGQVMVGEDGLMYWQQEDDQGNIVQGGRVGPEELGAMMMAHDDMWNYYDQQQEDRGLAVQEFNAMSAHEKRMADVAQGWATVAARSSGFSYEDVNAITQSLSEELDKVYDETMLMLAADDDEATLPPSLDPANRSLTQNIAANIRFLGNGELFDNSASIHAARGIVDGGAEFEVNENNEAVGLVSNGVYLPMTRQLSGLLEGLLAEPDTEE